MSWGEAQTHFSDSKKAVILGSSGPPLWVGYVTLSCD